MRRTTRTVPVALLGSVCVVLAACSGSSARHLASGPTSGTHASETTAPPLSTTTSAPRPRDLKANSSVTFAFAGDTQFPDQMDDEPGAISTGLPLLSDRVRADPTGVLAAIAPVLSSADLAMVNLETAITDRGTPVPGKNFHFRSPAASFEALRAAGVDVVSMANNHALDYGPVGMDDTFAAIAASKLPVIGIGHDAAEAYRPYRTVINGQRIAIFSAVDWLEPRLIPAWSATEAQAGLAFSIDRARLLGAIRAVRPEVDTLVVFLHWGTETTYCASPEQHGLAQALLGAGADIIVGSHAHRVFGAGRVGNGFVAYGLGNFVYWREDGESGRSGVLLVTATGRHVDRYSWVPARIAHGIPVPETGTTASADGTEWARRRTCSGLAP